MSSSSLISFVALEEALRSLEARLSQRDAEVAELRSAVAAAASKDDVNALVTPIRASLDNLAERVDALERAVFIDTAALRREATSVGGSGASLGSGAVTLGEVVSALHKGAVASMRQLDDMATREELRRELARVEAEARSEREALDASKASASLVSRSEAVARTTREAVLALESVVATKVDKMELARLESAMQAVHDFSDLQSRLSRDIDRLVARIDTLEESSVAVGGAAESAAKQAARALSAVDDCVTTESVEALISRVTALSNSVEDAVSVDALGAVQDAAAELAGRVARLESVEQGTTRRQEGVLAELSEQVALKADSADMASKLDELAAQSTALASSLTAAVETRATITAVEATDEQVVRLSAALDDVERRLAVALKFVDWYSARGEAYEHNAAAIETHMRSLAMKSRAVDCAHDRLAAASVRSAASSHPLSASSGAHRQTFGGPTAHLPPSMPFSMATATPASSSSFVQHPGLSGVGGGGGGRSVKEIAAASGTRAQT